jgi:hypothetical protein
MAATSDYHVVRLSSIPKVLLVTGGSQGLVQGAAVASILSGERLRKKAWICYRRPGQLTAVFAT